MNDCGHPADVELSWHGLNNERRTVKACEACAAIIWAAMAQPLRETFTCQPVTA